MTAKPRKTDWKKLAQEEGMGRELLAQGTRSSTGNEGKFNNLQNLPTDKARLDAVMAMMQGNMGVRAAKQKRKAGSYHPGLKGLFGGG